MKTLLSFPVVVLCGLLSLLGITDTLAATWHLTPGITNRGASPSSWELDLRKGEAEAKAAAAGLSSRIYGPSETRLHHPLLLRANFSEARILGINLSAVSSGGSDLLVMTNGVLCRKLVWPSGGSTHRVNQVLWLPLSLGESSVSLSVSHPGGVVVISDYYVTQSPAELPASFHSVALQKFESAVLKTSAASAHPVYEKEKYDDGYRGIWYYNQPSGDEYKFKYSGGFATYPQQHAPIAIYASAVQKTFFCYGGTQARSGSDPQVLLHMVSYFDHKTGEVHRPRILLNKQTSDAHDNPTMSVDDAGFIWIFSSSHGTGRPSFIHRSKRPYDIDEFELILATNFSYTQPWWLPGHGFVFLHTRYNSGSEGTRGVRGLHWMTSADGKKWSTPTLLANIEQGDYQVSWPNGNTLSTAFDYHPAPLGLNARANIYFVQTCDGGNTWATVSGQKVSLPLTTTNNPALVYNSRAEGLLVYLKDINYDANGNPIILFLTSKGYESGPKNNPRTWQTARWTGGSWVRHPVTTSDNNYDHGSLYIEPDGAWRVIAPTDPGPQAFNPGGEMVMWTSTDQGVTWNKLKKLTQGSPMNHTYARRPLHAHPDFYALWADGNARQPSESHLYFTDQQGTHVWRLPAKMTGDFAKPEVAF